MINKQTARDKGLKIIDSQQVLVADKSALIEGLKALLPNVINTDNQLDIKRSLHNANLHVAPSSSRAVKALTTCCSLVIPAASQMRMLFYNVNVTLHQYFCAYPIYTYELPCNATELVHVSKRVGVDGFILYG